MNAILRLWFEWRALPAFGTIAFVVLASTGLLIACAVIARVMSRSSAAARHMVWLMTFVGLALVLAVAFVPRRLEWAVLPTRSSAIFPREVSATLPLAPTPLPVYTKRAPKPILAPEVEEVVVSDLNSPSWPRIERVPWTTVLLYVWIVGSVFALCPLLFGTISLRLLRRRSESVMDASLPGALTQYAAAVGVKRKVEVLISDRVSVPMTWGVWNPVILLPRKLLNAPECRLRAVLLHELAHIRRADFATQTFARAVTSFFWFHPFAWMALHQLRLEREMACDDVVVNQQEEAFGYAEELLALARELGRPSLALRTGVAMAQKSQLELRLRAIVDFRRVRKAASWRKWGPVFALVAILVLGVGLVRPVAAQLSTQVQTASENGLSPELVKHLEALSSKGPEDLERVKTRYAEVELLTDHLNAADKTWKTSPQPSITWCWVDRRSEIRYRVDSTPAVRLWTDGAAPFHISNETLIGRDGKETRYDHDRPGEARSYGSTLREVWDAGDQFLLAHTDVHWQARFILRRTADRDAKYSVVLEDGPQGRLLRIERQFLSGTEQITRYWLDPARGYALIRREFGFRGKIRTTDEVHELAQIQPGLWLPVRATVTSESQRNHFKFVKHEIGVEIPDSTFVFTTVDMPYTAEAPSVKVPAKDFINFTVVDRATKKPIASVPLAVTGKWLCGDPDPTIRMTTDAQGTIKIPLSKEEVETLQIVAKAPGYVPTVVRWSKKGNKAAPISQDYVLDVEKGTEISGRILDEEQNPIAGAKVELSINGGPSIWDVYVKRVTRSVTLTTDAEGRWKCDGMPADLATLSVRLEHPNFLSDNYGGSYRQRSPLPISALRDGSSYLVMKHGLVLAGRITDATGRPIAGAAVKQGLDRWGSNFPMTKTGSDGRFRFANTAPGKTTLTVEVNGYAPDTQTFELSASREDVTFALQPAKRIKVRVTDPDDRPVSGVHAVANRWRDNNRALDYRVATDAEGRFEWKNAPYDAVLFDFVGDGVEKRNVSLIAGEEEHVVQVTRK